MSETFKEGTFCWFELSTTDNVAARAFYSDVIGWSYNEMPMPGDAPGMYITAKNGDNSVAGMYTLDSAMRDKGIPPHWSLYVAVDDIDASAAKVKQLGGTIVEGPFDIPEVGRMAVCRDPAGAHFSLWHAASQHKGVGQHDGGIGAQCWSELVSDNVDASGKFFSSLFGWSPAVQDMGGMQYTVFSLGDTQVAGMMAKSEQFGPMPSAWIVYWHVADIDATVKRVEAKGGKVLMPPMDIPEVGRFAWICDPQGAMSAMITLAAK